MSMQISGGNSIPKNASWIKGQWMVPGPNGRMVKYDAGPDVTVIEIEVGVKRSKVEEMVLGDIRAFEAFARSKGYDLTVSKTGDYLNYVTQVAWQGFYAGRKGSR